MEKFKDVKVDEFLTISSHLIVNYAKERGCLKELIEKAPDGVKEIFQSTLQDIRDKDLEEILKNEK